MAYTRWLAECHYTEHYLGKVITFFLKCLPEVNPQTWMYICSNLNTSRNTHLGEMEKIHCTTTPCWRAKELQEIKTAMAAAKDEGKGPSGKDILLPVHWVPGPEKKPWCQGKETCAPLSWHYRMHHCDNHIII